jgi:hypothetical protein
MKHGIIANDDAYVSAVRVGVRAVEHQIQRSLITTHGRQPRVGPKLA